MNADRTGSASSRTDEQFRSGQSVSIGQKFKGAISGAPWLRFVAARFSASCCLFSSHPFSNRPFSLPLIYSPFHFSWIVSKRCVQGLSQHIPFRLQHTNVAIELMYRVNEFACQAKKCSVVPVEMTFACHHEGIFTAPLENKKRKII